MGFNPAMRVAIIALLVMGLGGLVWRGAVIYQADQRAQKASAYLAELERAGANATAEKAEPGQGPSVSKPGGSGETKRTLVVHVDGAVKNPGIYTFEEGARVHDAVLAAGGALPEGVPGALNLAALLTDGAKLYIYTKAELQPAAQTPVAAQGATFAPVVTTQQSSTSGSGLVNVNTAGQSELETVPGIGPVTAKAIIEYRTKHGPFQQVDDLMGVSGIGAKTLEKLRPYVQV